LRKSKKLTKKLHRNIFKYILLWKGARVELGILRIGIFERREGENSCEGCNSRTALNLLGVTKSFVD